MVPEVTLEPKQASTMVTAAMVDKKLGSKSLIKEAEARDIVKLKKRFEDIVGADAGSQLDVFRIRDEGSRHFMLVRFPQDKLEQMMQESGKDGLFIRTPKDKVADYKVICPVLPFLDCLDFLG